MCGLTCNSILLFGPCCEWTVVRICGYRDISKRVSVDPRGLGIRHSPWQVPNLVNKSIDNRQIYDTTDTLERHSIFLTSDELKCAPCNKAKLLQFLRTMSFTFIPGIYFVNCAKVIFL